MPNQYNEDQKALTITSILTSLLALMNKKEFKTIKISELCKAAGVSRMAFYRHYKDIEEVLAIHLEERFEAYFSEAENLNLSSTYNTSHLLFSYIKNEQKFFTTLINSGHLESLHQYFENFMMYIFKSLPLGYDLDNDALTYYAAYRAGGLVRLVAAWVDHDFDESIDAMAKLATIFDL